MRDFKVKFISKTMYGDELITNKEYIANPYIMRCDDIEWVLVKNEKGVEVYYDLSYFEFVN